MNHKEMNAERRWPYDGEEGRARLTGNVGGSEISDEEAERIAEFGCEHCMGLDDEDDP